ncbi:MAG: DUF1302 domain-containing protein [Comamonadaceae bacterium]|nr:DUF1302 domain-containing protein [Comamonadaceae bacterium]
MNLSVIVTGVCASSASAFEFDTGNSDVSIHWDNTIKYSNAFRLKDQSSKLLADANGDDGDRNFNKGLISNRLDLFSELDLTYRDFGARVSGAAWYDQVYNQSTDNNSPSTSNQPLGDSRKFPTATEKLHGRKAELMDAFVFGRGTIGDTRWSFRAGQYAQQWGETLFFGANGIAGGQAPIDVIKALSVPGTQFKELIRPTEQFSFSLQPNQDLLFSAYVQTEWEASRLPGAGSYFGADILDKGGDRLLAGVPPLAPNALYFQRGGDMQAKDSGQWGVQMRFRLPNGLTDYGLYAIRYHDKTPNLYLRPGVGASGNIVGSYQLAYQEGVRAYGFSANHTFGPLNLATEISARRNTALVNDGVPLAPGVIPGRNDPLYPVGNSVHVNVSALWTLPVSPLFREASFLGEVAWNRRTSITKNAEFLAANATRDATAIRFVFTPTYRQVLSGLDLDVPFGVGYTPKGTSSVVSAFGPDHGGDVSFGVNATYFNVWKASINLTHYFGPEDTGTDKVGHLTFKQTLKDRDFIALSVRRTF